MNPTKRHNPHGNHHRHHHEEKFTHPYSVLQRELEWLTQRIFHLWIFFTFFTMAGSESGVGSSSSFQTATDEVVGTPEARGPVGCQFPSHWTGSWFQSGIHHRITISSSTISTKGRCLEVDGEKYLVYDQRSNCHKCLVFSEKHANVLQYKETYCIYEKRPLRSICSTISGDANLYAMFRLDAQPIDCPLQGPFTFSYNRGYGLCQLPESTLSSCTQPSRLLFNYQACPDVPKTESVEEELQCLAAWKEGSYRYFLGLIHYRHHASSYEERFRCFAYEVISTSTSNTNSGANVRRGELLSHTSNQQYPQSLALGRSRPRPYHGTGISPSFNNSQPQSLTAPSQIMYRVEQSDDATCNGLSTMEGSRTMFLRKAPESTSENCQFPSWVQNHPQWHTLDQSSIYEFDEDRFRVTNYSAELIVNANGPDSLAVSGTCLKMLQDEPGHRALIVLHARAGCKIGYQCMALYKRDSDILEVQFGEWSRKHEEACLYFYDPYIQPYITLISSTPKSAQCPTIGEFSLKLPPNHLRSSASQGSAATCTTNGTLRMGCSALDSMQLETSSRCQDHNHHLGEENPFSKEVTDYNCHGWWEEDGFTYLVTTLSSTSTKLRPKRHCFVLRDPSTAEPPEWMRLKASQGEGQMSGFQHSNGGGGGAAGQHLHQEGSPGSRNRQMDTHSTSAALFFFNNNNNNHHAAGKTLEISSFADSCRRNVAVGREGDYAFNATKTGHCFASSSSPAVMVQGNSVGRVPILAMKGMLTSLTTLNFRLETLMWSLPALVAILMH